MLAAFGDFMQNVYNFNIFFQFTEFANHTNPASVKILYKTFIFETKSFSVTEKRTKQFR